MVMAVACQSSASASPTPDAAASGAIPSFVGAPDLEATLPDEAGGIVFQSFSMSGPDFVDAEIDDQFVAFINGLGADIDQVAVAVAIGAAMRRATRPRASSPSRWPAQRPRI